jgi:hypothetical protein
MSKGKRLLVGVWAVVAVGLVAYAVRARDDAPVAAPAQPEAVQAASPSSPSRSTQSSDALSAAGADMAAAANNLLAALAPEQQSKISFEFKDEERYNWHFIPRARKGLPLKDMTHAQRPLAHALLSTGLGQRGYVEAVTIISLEQILKDIEKGTGPNRDPELYFFSIFGKPGPKGTWGWRVEGHHVSLNFTVVDGRATAGGPAFFGSNPGEVRDGPRKGLRVLAAEEDIGRQLVTSLDESQRKTAILPGAAPGEIITKNDRKAMLTDDKGIAVSALTPPQRQALMSLIDLYARRLRTEMAEQDLRKLMDAGVEKVRFAWAGGLERGQPHYYRIVGPTFLIEYDNTQNNANHIHTVWRDLTNDFGEDVLKKHYDQTPHGEGR